MPLFSSKTLKKAPARKAPVSLESKDLSPERLKKELGPEVGTISICLGEQRSVFKDGEWISQSRQTGDTFKENEKLKKEIKMLKEEYNLLKEKFDVMLNMLTEKTAENDKNKDEVRKLRYRLSYTRKSTS